MAGTAGSGPRAGRGQAGKPARVRAHLRGRCAPPAPPGLAADPDASAARGWWESPRAGSCFCGLPPFPARAPRRQGPRGSVAPKVTLRRRTDLGGPGSLEIQPPCVPALGDLGFEPRPGEKGCARTSLTPACLPLGVASVAVCVTCPFCLLTWPLSTLYFSPLCIPRAHLGVVEPCFYFCLHLASVSLDPVFPSESLLSMACL